MTGEQSFDVLIVGQGLAGTLLSVELMARGLSVCVVDDGHRSSSTRMAAGLLNPVTGLRLTRARQVERFLPVALRRYRALEQSWGCRFFFEKPMLRLFRDERQRRDWEKRLKDPGYREYLLPPLTDSDIPSILDAPHGAGLQRHTGYMDTPVFLDAGRRWLAEHEALREGNFDWADLERHDGWIRWHDLSARRVISCEGYRGMHHPVFPWLPFRPCKGQILTLHSTRPLPDWILNRGHWLVPVGDGRVRVGATYEREDIDSGPDAAARDNLLEAAGNLFTRDMDWRLEAEAAGVRPGTRDKMPLVGLHPDDPRFGMFNGFGSKGVMMAPWYAICLADHLERGTPLPEEASLQRWWNPHG